MYVSGRKKEGRKERKKGAGVEGWWWWGAKWETDLPSLLKRWAKPHYSKACVGAGVERRWPRRRSRPAQRLPALQACRQEEASDLSACTNHFMGKKKNKNMTKSTHTLDAPAMLLKNLFRPDPGTKSYPELNPGVKFCQCFQQLLFTERPCCIQTPQSVAPKGWRIVIVGHMEAWGTKWGQTNWINHIT